MIFQGEIFNYFRQNFLQAKSLELYMSLYRLIFSHKTLNRHIFALLIVIISLTNNLFSQNRATDFRMPAEFEQQQAVWFGWEEEDTHIQKTIGNIITGLLGKVPVKIAIHTPELEDTVRQTLFKLGIDADQVTFYVVPGQRLWIRDNGATFLVNDNNDFGVVDFEWSNYGYYDWLLNTRPKLAAFYMAMKMNSKENQFSNADKEMASITKAKTIKSKLAMEGGALETNGKGVLLQSEQVTLQRNPGWTKEEIEEEYLKIMNIKKVIWVKEGTADDARSFMPYDEYISLGTGGHIDEFARFADSNTILLAWIGEKDKNKHPLNLITYNRMHENYEILKKATDQDGNPFRIIKIPLPSIIEWPATIVEKAGRMEFNKVEANRLAIEDQKSIGKQIKRVASVSYLNFLVSNGVIINASYTNHGTSREHEDKVKAIFKNVFPNLEQVWVDVLPLNRNGGGIHCVTLPEPLQNKNKKSIIP